MEIDGMPDQSRLLKLRAAAEALEGAFLAEMLKPAEAKNDFGGGVGEGQFASFLREAQAKQLVRAGGVGLSESLFTALIRGRAAMRNALALMEATREAIVAGRFERLTELIDATDDLLAQLPRASGEELAIIRARALRNQGLIRAALTGLRPSASLNGSFSAYGTDGRRITDSTGPAVERKA